MRRGLLVMAMVLGAARAHAGACPDATVRVVPAEPMVAPTNTQVRVTFQGPRVTVRDLQDHSRQILAEAVVAAADAAISLRDASGAAIAATVRRLPSTTLPTFVLTPSAPLAAQARYAVIVTSGGADYAVARFDTGAAADTAAPSLTAVTRARLYRHPPVRDWKDPAGPYARLWLDGAADDGPLALEIHALAAGADAGDATLRTIVSAGDPRFGASDACAPADFTFARRGPIRLGVRAIDLAGNVSPLRAVTLR